MLAKQTKEKNRRNKENDPCGSKVITDDQCPSGQLTNAPVLIRNSFELFKRHSKIDSEHSVKCLSGYKECSHAVLKHLTW